MITVVADWSADWSATDWRDDEGGGHDASSMLQVRGSLGDVNRLGHGSLLSTPPLADGSFFPCVSEHADGERRGPVSIWRYLKTRLSGTFPVPPSDPI